MKTTVDIADALLVEAKKLAKERDITLRELIERGLRAEVERCSRRVEAFVWKDLSYGDPNKTTWLRPEFERAGWEAIRDVANERPWLTRFLQERDSSGIGDGKNPDEAAGPSPEDDLDESPGSRP